MNDRVSVLGGRRRLLASIAFLAASASAALPRARPDPAASAGLEWVSIPGGAFMMGEEDYAHPVSVRGFQLARSEVTNGQYRACVKAGMCSPPATYIGGDDYPVVFVDWAQARSFSEWVGGRLPSEAEWEYAARTEGGHRLAPLSNISPACQTEELTCCGVMVFPVCPTSSDGSGPRLCGMDGNAREWVKDWYHSSFKRAPDDGSAWEVPAGSFRVGRGGCWNGVAWDSGSAYRREYDPKDQDTNLGFRPARGGMEFCAAPSR